MADANELLEKWQSSKAEERYDVVENFLLKAGFVKVSDKGGSHFVFQHPLLKEAFKLFPNNFSRDFHPSGDLVIVKHKNKVQNWYLKHICKAMRYIREIEEIKGNK